MTGSTRIAAMTNQRTAVVGGGASGIGYAAAAALASRGHRGVITGRHEATLAAAARALNAGAGNRAEHAAADRALGSSLGADVAAPDSAVEVITHVEAEWGGPDVLVANAGGPPPARILDISDDQ